MALAVRAMPSIAPAPAVGLCGSSLAMSGLSSAMNLPLQTLRGVTRLGVDVVVRVGRLLDGVEHVLRALLRTVDRRSDRALHTHHDGDQKLADQAEGLNIEGGL